MKKQSLRTAYKQKRKSLMPSTISSLSLEIANQALKLPIWEASFYHLFLSINPLKEVETEPLLSVLYGRDKNIVIPKSDILNGEMSHYLLTENTTIKPNIWNIAEPQDGVQIEASKLEVIFVPLLAFDKVGHRVGYGKGFYDGFLKNCPNAVKIGLSFFEADEKIKDIQPNDIALDYCLTPNQIYQF
jgi:5-formyltetrahydrofolate cyclo-ligase